MTQERSHDWAYPAHRAPSTDGCESRRLPNSRPSSIHLSMRPADNPEFFRRPAPDGLSRESSLRLDGEGRFWHDGELVDHPRLLTALHRWITRHPNDGRFILSNGYDWTYFTVDDVPYSVRGVQLGAEPRLLLSDDTIEVFPRDGYRIGRAGALYCPVKAGAFEARFTPSAQNELGPLLSADDDGLYLAVGATQIRLPSAG